MVFPSLAFLPGGLRQPVRGGKVPIDSWYQKQTVILINGNFCYIHEKYKNMRKWGERKDLPNMVRNFWKNRPLNGLGIK